MQLLDVALVETEELRTDLTSFLQTQVVVKGLGQIFHPGDPSTSLHCLVIQKPKNYSGEFFQVNHAKSLCKMGEFGPSRHHSAQTGGPLSSLLGGIHLTQLSGQHRRCLHQAPQNRKMLKSKRTCSRVTIKRQKNVVIQIQHTAQPRALQSIAAMAGILP